MQTIFLAFALSFDHAVSMLMGYSLDSGFWAKLIVWNVCRRSWSPVVLRPSPLSGVKRRGIFGTFCFLLLSFCSCQS